jgi:hypothetical protein
LGNLYGVPASGFTTNPDTGGMITGMPKRRSTSPPNPVTTSIVLFRLFFNPLLKFLQQFIEIIFLE